MSAANCFMSEGCRFRCVWSGHTLTARCLERRRQREKHFPDHSLCQRRLNCLKCLQGLPDSETLSRGGDFGGAGVGPPFPHLQQFWSG